MRGAKAGLGCHNFRSLVPPPLPAPDVADSPPAAADPARAAPAPRAGACPGTAAVPEIAPSPRRGGHGLRQRRRGRGGGGGSVAIICRAEGSKDRKRKGIERAVLQALTLKAGSPRIGEG